MYWYEEPVDDVSEPERAWSWKAMVGWKWEARAGNDELKDRTASGRSRWMSEGVECKQVLATSCGWREAVNVDVVLMCCLI